MLFHPVSIGIQELSDRELNEDLENLQKAGPFALGKHAAYFNGRIPGQKKYLVYSDIRRIFKRIAMTKGGFTGKGIFSSMAYIAALLPDGSERQFRVNTEEEADAFLREFHKLCPTVPTVSKKSEEKIAAAKKAQAEKLLPKLTPEASSEIAELEKARKYLEEKPAIPAALSRSASGKRSIDQMNPAYRYLVFCMLAGGMICCLWGAAALLRDSRTGIYPLMIGAALLLFSLTSRILPFGRSSPRYAARCWEEALSASRAYVDAYGGSFPLPCQYAHPAALTRMIRSIREGRAQTAAEASELLKEDLRAATSDVTVSQEEYDEITAIKPMYLLCGYRDEL